MKAKVELGKRQKRLGVLKIFQDGDEEIDETPDTVDGLNASIGKHKNRLQGKELEDWQKARANVKATRQRQADASFYVVLAFDTGGQCNAFVDYLVGATIIPDSGDLFLDGRHLAEHLGIVLPAPEYPMDTKVLLAKGRTKDMPKIPRASKRRSSP